MVRYVPLSQPREVSCLYCAGRSALVCEALGVCADCIRRRPRRVMPHIRKVHAEARKRFCLPARPPRAVAGAPCNICVHECRIPRGGLGFCGLRANRGGRLVHLGGRAESGILQWYYDPLPTNCVAEWACAEMGTVGGNNLAVFYGACSFNCLFCQNWNYRALTASLSPKVAASELAAQVDAATACVCFFGGDPSPQMPHAIATAELAMQRPRPRPLRICWETNGTMHPLLLRKAARLSMQSGGTIKFDLKAWDDNLHVALTGVSNCRTLENFQRVAEWGRQRPDPPLLAASTLLVPGYVDAQEVRQLATFIASLDPRIPYSLLAFHPCFCMGDLPSTSRGHASQCWQAAKEAGLLNLRIGNPRLLSDLY